MKIAMNKRASCALLTGDTWGFNAHAFAEGGNENVAIQDLTPKLLAKQPQFLRHFTCECAWV
jgi:hypothetical protein